MSTFLILFISLICDAFILIFLWQGQKFTQKSILDKFDTFDRQAQITH